MSKKILFVIGSGVYPHVVGGMEVFNYYLIKNLRYKAKICCLAAEKYDFNNIDFIKTFHIRPTKFTFPLQLFIRLLFHRFDKIVYSYSSAHWIIWWLFEKIAGLFRIPYVVVIHYGKQPPKDHAEAYRRFFSSAENVIAVSADIKRNFDDKYGICCQIIPPLVPFEKSKIDKILLRKTYNIPFDATAICMVGSIKGMKNPDTILEAVNMIGKEEIEKYNLHIIYAGSGEMTEMLKHKADGYGLGERVHFLGFVPKEKVNEVMSLSDLYVIASDFEGTSVSLLEAMYNGIPVIASNAPGIKDTITPKECTMFPTRDAAVLKNAVLTMITDKPLCERLAENARQRYLNLYDYDNVISSYLSILNR